MVNRQDVETYTVEERKCIKKKSLSAKEVKVAKDLQE